jgi:hypothetical protein
LRFVFLILSFYAAIGSAAAQKDTSKHKVDSLPERFYILQNVERDGEKLPEIEIKEVTIKGKGKPQTNFQYWRYERLVYNVRVVYPYALIVREKLKDVNAHLEKLPDDRERKKYIKDVEKEVFRDYEGDMEHLTFTQGKLLIRLIDRETENTSYDLIKDYRGNLSAAFWQGIARLFGTNLKEEYDPLGDDYLIEKIILEIESGRL